MTLERRRLLLDRAHVRLGHRPVAASRRHVARRPVRQGDDPAILRLDGQGDRALAGDHGAVPRAGQVLGAGQPGERQRGDDEQAALEALRGRGLERRSRRAHVAVAEEQEALQREQDEAGGAPRRRGILEPAVERGMGFRSRAGEAEPERQRRCHEQAGGRVAGRECHRPLRPLDRLVVRGAERWRGTRCAARSSRTAGRRRRPRAGPTRASAAAAPLPDRPRTSRGRPGRCRAGVPRRTPSDRRAGARRHRRPSTASPRSPPARAARDRRAPGSGGSRRSGSTRRSTMRRVTSPRARASRGRRAARRW